MDMMQVGDQQMLKKRRVSPLSLLLPGVQTFLWDVYFFEAQISALTKEHMLRMSTKYQILSLLLLYKGLGTWSDKMES